VNSTTAAHISAGEQIPAGYLNSMAALQLGWAAIRRLLRVGYKGGQLWSAVAATHISCSEPLVYGLR